MGSRLVLLGVLPHMALHTTPYMHFTFTLGRAMHINMLAFVVAKPTSSPVGPHPTPGALVGDEGSG